MKKNILLLALVVASGFCHLYGADYPWLTFTFADGSQTSVAADGLHLSYNGGELNLRSDTVAQSFPVASLKSMRFAASSAGVVDITGDSDTAVELFTMQGLKVGTFASLDNARDRIAPGVYLAKGRNTTLKVIF